MHFRQKKHQLRSWDRVWEMNLTIQSYERTTRKYITSRTRTEYLGMSPTRLWLRSLMTYLTKHLSWGTFHYDHSSIGHKWHGATSTMQPLLSFCSFLRATKLTGKICVDSRMHPPHPGAVCRVGGRTDFGKKIYIYTPNKN